MRFLRTNTAVRVTVGPFFDKTDGVTPETSLTVTSCKLTFMVDDANVPTLIIDASATASGGNNDMVHVSGDDAGFYDLELTAAQTNYLGRAMLAITDAANHCPVFHEFMILPAMIYDSMVLGTDRLDTNVTHISDQSQTARDLGVSVLLSPGTGTGQVDVTGGVVKANVTQWLGGTIPAVNTTGIPLVDAKLWLGGTIPAVNTTGVPKVDLVLWLGLAPLGLTSQQVQAVVPITQKVDVNTIVTKSITGPSGNFVLGNYIGQANGALSVDGSGVVQNVATVATVTTVTQSTNAGRLISSGYMGDFSPSAATAEGYFFSCNDNGLLALTGIPAFEVRKSDGTATTSELTITYDAHSVTGLNKWSVAVLNDTGTYVAGEYTVLSTAGTVGTTSVIGQIAGSFSLDSRSALRSATAGETANISGGIIQSDMRKALGNTLTEGANGRFANAMNTQYNVASPVFTAASVNQTGDGFARLGAPAGASHAADVAAVKTDTGNLVTRITSTLFSGITSLAQWLGSLAGKQSPNSTAQTEMRATGAGSGTYDATTDSQEATSDVLPTGTGLRALFASAELGTAQAGGASTITLRAGANATDNFYKNMVAVITGGTGAGQAPRRISSYVGATKVATVSVAWVTQPDSTSTYELLGYIEA